MPDIRELAVLEHDVADRRQTDGGEAGLPAITTEQRRRIDELKSERAQLADPFDRIAFDNQRDDFVLRIVAALESP